MPLSGFLLSDILWNLQVRCCLRLTNQEKPSKIEIIWRRFSISNQTLTLVNTSMILGKFQILEHLSFKIFSSELLGQVWLYKYFKCKKTSKLEKIFVASILGKVSSNCTYRKREFQGFNENEPIYQLNLGILNIVYGFVCIL